MDGVRAVRLGDRREPLELKEALRTSILGLPIEVNPSYNLMLTANGLHRGAGIPQEGMKKALADMVGIPATESRVAHIINGGDNERDTGYMRWTSATLTAMGFEVVELDLRETTGRQLRKALDKFNVIYVEGGNAFYLLKLARQSKFDRHLKGWLDEGRTFVGMCAGAKVVGPGLHIALSKNDVRIRKLDGIGLVPIDPWMHYEDRHEKRLLESSARVGYSVVPVRNSEALKISHGTIELITSDTYGLPKLVHSVENPELAPLRRDERQLELPA